MYFFSCPFLPLILFSFSRNSSIQKSQTSFCLFWEWTKDLEFAHSLFLLPSLRCAGISTGELEGACHFKCESGSDPVGVTLWDQPGTLCLNANMILLLGSHQKWCHVLHLSVSCYTVELWQGIGGGGVHISHCLPNLPPFLMGRAQIANQEALWTWISLFNK